MKNLFVIADDLGLAKSVNDGIIFLLKSGKISGASLMANGEAFDDAVVKYVENVGSVRDDGNDQFKQVKRSNERSDSSIRTTLGIHFVLVEENSLSGVKLPKNYKIFFIKYIFGLLKLAEIEKELRAQLEKIINSGIKPNFMNSHQHLHLLPGILNVVIKLAKEYQISYIRVVNEIVFIPRSYYKYDALFFKFFRFGQLLFLKLLSNLAKRKIKKANLKFNNFFVGFINAGNISSDDVELAKYLVQKYPDKIIELGCHPGYENEELKIKYKEWGDYNWEKELNLLSSHYTNLSYDKFV